jgi:hypothetical protein
MTRRVVWRHIALLSSTWIVRRRCHCREMSTTPDTACSPDTGFVSLNMSMHRARRRVRFSDEATEFEVEGEEAPRVYTAPEGVQSLVTRLKAALDVIGQWTNGGTVGLLVKAKPVVLAALQDVQAKCGLNLVGGYRCKARQLAGALVQIYEPLKEEADIGLL